jgi:hypothetical protein
MAFEQREKQGQVFKNEKTKPSQPDYRGEFMLNGVVYRQSFWLKDGKRGKWMSQEIRPKEDTQAAEKPATRPRADLDDSVPF